MTFALNSASSSPAFPPRRSAGIENGSISPLTPAQDMIFQEVDVLLQAISPKNSHVISRRILAIAQVASDEETLIRLLRTVLDRAADDPAHSSIYLGLCSEIAVLRAERKESGSSNSPRSSNNAQHRIQPIIEEVESPEPSRILPTKPADLLRPPFGHLNFQERPSRDEHEHGGPFSTPKLNPNLITTLNTPLLAAQRHFQLQQQQHMLPRPPSPPSPPLTPPKTIRTRTSPSSTDIPTISSMLQSSSPPGSSNVHPQHHNPTRVIRSNSSTALAAPAPRGPPAIPPELPEGVIPNDPHSPPVNLSSIERWLDGVNDPEGCAPRGHSVQSIAHILDDLTPNYADTRDNLLACMDYADSKTVCYVACAIAEKATEALEGAVTCAKLCVELESALAASADIEDDDDEDDDDDDDDYRASGARTIASQAVDAALTLTGDMFKRLLAIFCWQNFEFSWVPPSYRSGTDDHLVSGLIQGNARRSVVLLKFIGELYKRSMLSRNFVHDCATMLLDQVGLPFEHISIPLASSPRDNMLPSPPSQENMGSYGRSSARRGDQSPNRRTGVSPARHRDRSGSLSQRPPFSQQYDGQPPAAPSAREMQSVRRYAVAIAVFIATIGHELDRRSKKDIDNYLDRMRLVAKKEALVSNYVEVGKVESHLSYLLTLRANKWRGESPRGRRPSYLAPPPGVPIHQRNFSA